jgi:hypothetical protein
MKLTKMRPCLMDSLLGLMDIVHRNTKEYMAASNIAWIAPSSAMQGSDGGQSERGRQERGGG